MESFPPPFLSALSVVLHITQSEEGRDTWQPSEGRVLACDSGNQPVD